MLCIFYTVHLNDPAALSWGGLQWDSENQFALGRAICNLIRCGFFFGVSFVVICELLSEKGGGNLIKIFFGLKNATQHVNV